MSKISILYFSSSRNTEYVAQIIAEGLKAHGFSVRLIPLEKFRSVSDLLDGASAIGIGAPVYALNLSPNILSILKSFPRNDTGLPFFLFDTKAFVSGAAIPNARRILDSKGYRFVGALEIFAPTFDSVFWVDFYNKVSWSKGTISRALDFGLKIGQVLKTNKGFVKAFGYNPLGGILSKLASKLERRIYGWLTKYMINIAAKCNHCGFCQRVCTTGAIRISQSIFFDPKYCILCFKCMRSCPRKALVLKKAEQFEFFKGPHQIKGYIAPEFLRRTK